MFPIEMNSGTSMMTVRLLLPVMVTGKLYLWKTGGRLLESGGSLLPSCVFRYCSICEEIPLKKHNTTQLYTMTGGWIIRLFLYQFKVLQLNFCYH